MKFTFWGVRGSIASPGTDTKKYGGNTSCVELRTDTGELFILDAGTGIRKLGLHLVEENIPVIGTVILTHAHWDHIEGIPFFRPLYFKKNQITFMGAFGGKYRVKDILHHALMQPYFPVSLGDLKADIQFNDITATDTVEMGGTKISMLQLNHPSYTLAYKFTEGQKTMVYMTDNELFCPTSVITPYEKIVEFCKGADVLIHDAMYTLEEWNHYKGWGHSSYESALHLGMDADVVYVILFHHDSERTDRELSALVKRCNTIIKKSKKDIQCKAAAEGEGFVI